MIKIIIKIVYCIEPLTVEKPAAHVEKLASSLKVAKSWGQNMLQH